MKKALTIEGEQNGLSLVVHFKLIIVHVLHEFNTPVKALCFLFFTCHSFIIPSIRVSHTHLE